MMKKIGLKVAVVAVLGTSIVGFGSSEFAQRDVESIKDPILTAQRDPAPSKDGKDPVYTLAQRDPAPSKDGKDPVYTLAQRDPAPSKDGKDPSLSLG